MTQFYISFQSVHSLDRGFVERVGPPDECTSALGHVFVGFSWLEQSLDRHIAELGQLSPAIAPAFTAELSFKTKVSILSSLVKAEPPLRQFNVGADDPSEVWKDFVRMLFECEDLRNKLSHSHWSLSAGTMIQRTKTTAKAARGIHVSCEDLSSKYLLDVYDYILNVQYVLDELFLEIT